MNVKANLLRLQLGLVIHSLNGVIESASNSEDTWPAVAPAARARANALEAQATLKPRPPTSPQRGARR